MISIESTNVDYIYVYVHVNDCLQQRRVLTTWLINCHSLSIIDLYESKLYDIWYHTDSIRNMYDISDKIYSRSR